MESIKSLLVFSPVSYLRQIYVCGSLFVLFTSYYHNYKNFISEYPLENEIAIIQSLVKGIVMGVLSPITIPLWVYASRCNKMFFLYCFTPTLKMKNSAPRKIYDRNNFSYPCWLFLPKNF